MTLRNASLAKFECVSIDFSIKQNEVDLFLYLRNNFRRKL